MCYRIFCIFFFFFFSSRRRHTRFDCDWSSDVCSSDLSASDVQSQLPIVLPVVDYRNRLAQPLLGGELTYRANITSLSRESADFDPIRSEEHTSELQSQSNLVCRLLLEKKKKQLRAKI